MDKKLNEAVAALRPQMVAALQRLVRRRPPMPSSEVTEASSSDWDATLRRNASCQGAP